jgi:hypothetical protein
VPAREKLNSAYAGGSVLIAALIGVLVQSWPVFLIVLAILLVLNVVAGEIRPTRRR